MQVRALISFGSAYGSFAQGDVFALPPDVDWLAAGLVAPVDVPPAEQPAGSPAAPQRKRSR